MKLSFSAEDEQFRKEIAAWLNKNLSGEFEKIRFRGGPGDEHMFSEERKVWEQKLVNNGGPEITCQNYNGNIYIRKKE